MDGEASDVETVDRADPRLPGVWPDVVEFPAFPRSEPLRSTRTTRRTRRPRNRVVAPAVAMAVLLGAFGAGFLGGWSFDRTRGSTTSGTAPATNNHVSTTFAGGSVDVAAALARVDPSVVSIDTTLAVYEGPFGGTATGAGTGMIIGTDGLVLTNAHVVAEATSITVTLPGSSKALRADLVGSDTNADIAVLRVHDAGDLTPAPLGDSDHVQVGDDVIAIGNALALEGGLTVTRGIVSAVDRSIETESGSLDGLIQTDTAISSGSSGGPLVSSSGQVIGMNTAIATSSVSNTAENIGFAIPITAAMKAANHLASS